MGCKGKYCFLENIKIIAPSGNLFWGLTEPDGAFCALKKAKPCDLAFEHLPIIIYRLFFVVC